MLIFVFRFCHFLAIIHFDARESLFLAFLSHVARPRVNVILRYKVEIRVLFMWISNFYV